MCQARVAQQCRSTDSALADLHDLTSVINKVSTQPDQSVVKKRKKESKPAKGRTVKVPATAVMFQDTFELLAPEEQRWLAQLLPPPDRSDISSALAHPAFRSGCQRFLRLLKCGLLEAEAASRWLPPRERGPDRQVLRWVLRCISAGISHTCMQRDACVAACVIRPWLCLLQWMDHDCDLNVCCTQGRCNPELGRAALWSCSGRYARSQLLVMLSVRLHLWRPAVLLYDNAPGIKDDTVCSMICCRCAAGWQGLGARLGAWD
jgi:hypothetical protein